MTPPRPGSVAVGGEHAEGGGLTADEIPRRHHMVDRLAPTDRAGRRRVSHRTIHRVVEGGGSVSVAGDGKHHQIRSVRRQGLERHPAAGREVGEEVACVGDEAREQFLRPITAEVDGDRALSLVEAGPIDRFAGIGQRPTPIVDPTADLIEPDDVSTELGEGHAPDGAATKPTPRSHGNHRAGVSARIDPLPPRHRGSRSAPATCSCCGSRAAAAGAVSRSS